MPSPNERSHGMKKIFLVFVLFAVFSCSVQDDHSSGTKKGDTVARVGDAVITKSDVLRRLQAVPPGASSLYTGEKGIMLMLEEMIKAELLYLYATGKGLDKDPSIEQKVNDFRKLMLANMVLEDIAAQIPPVTDSEAKEFYTRNKKSFSYRKIRASHILVDTPDAAEQVVRELEKGTGFQKAAQKWSLDRESARNGGDIGYFRRNEMLPEFEEAAFSLKKGEISRPVRSRAGYHIIKITDIQPGKTVSFSDAKVQIMDQLRKEHEKEAFDSFIEDLKTRFPVNVDPEKLRAITVNE